MQKWSAISRNRKICIDLLESLIKNLNKPAVLVLSKSFFPIADYAISRGHGMSSDFIIFHSSLVSSHPSHQKEMHEKPASNHIKSEFLSWKSAHLWPWPFSRHRAATIPESERKADDGSRIESYIESYQFTRFECGRPISWCNTTCPSLEDAARSESSESRDWKFEQHKSDSRCCAQRNGCANCV